VNRIFVYGSLKRGGNNHAFLHGQSFLGTARTAPGFRLFDLGDYPGMVAWPGDNTGVEGEVWAVDAACLLRLDELEGTAEGLYRRAAVPLLAPFAEQVVETYFYLHPIEGRRDAGSVWIEPKRSHNT
jgi:gamma-glutamylcyclotransferase (GGCT)/AIG2-like uncharacterized protein YtfP